MILAFLLMLQHFISDFLLQSDKMAINKSKDNFWLIAHTSLYSVAFLPLLVFLELPVEKIIQFIIITYGAHTVTDFFTSRWTSYLYLKNKRHWFFVVIGFDQVLHYAQLFGTYHLLTK